MCKHKWKIYWNEYSADTYLYGSEIIYNKKEDIYFKNELMPPGTIIKQWYSKVNFQEKRVEPTLPIIVGEATYRIKIDIDSPTPQGCLIRLVFFDKYENEAGNVVVRGTQKNFRCPLKTYSYQMQLINGGLTELNFHSIEIQEIEDEAKETDKQTKKDS